VRTHIAILGVSIIAGCGGTEPPTPPPTPAAIEDIELSAFVDTNADGLAYNDAPTKIRLSDYFADKRPGTKIVMLNAATGWCAPCQQEATAMKEFHAMFEPRGVAILTAVIQDQDGKPADEQFTKLWAETFQLPIPTAIDSSFATSKFFDIKTMPANMFVDAEKKQVLKIATGAEPGDDPMKAYRELLEHYLNPQ
jgi:hypothetical protein